MEKAQQPGGPVKLQLPKWFLIIRVVQLLLAIIVLGLTGYLIAAMDAIDFPGVSLGFVTAVQLCCTIDKTFNANISSVIWNLYLYCNRRSHRWCLYDCCQLCFRSLQHVGNSWSRNLHGGLLAFQHGVTRSLPQPFRLPRLHIRCDIQEARCRLHCWKGLPWHYGWRRCLLRFRAVSILCDVNNIEAYKYTSILFIATLAMVAVRINQHRMSSTSGGNTTGAGSVPPQTHAQQSQPILQSQYQSQSYAAPVGAASHDPSPYATAQEYPMQPQQMQQPQQPQQQQYAPSPVQSYPTPISSPPPPQYPHPSVSPPPQQTYQPQPAYPQQQPGFTQYPAASEMQGQGVQQVSPPPAGVNELPQTKQ
jgi:hypothetical protein